MDLFDDMRVARSDDQAVSIMVACAQIAMKQFYPKISTVEEVEDNLDLESLYTILDIGAGIKMKSEQKPEQEVVRKANESETSWNDLDLAKLESEVFLLGIWKDFDQLETHISMPELTKILEAKRDGDYEDRKFLAALQGVDLDKQSGKSDANAWENLKAKVFSGGQAADANDILAYQGLNAQTAGFGIGMGLSYERID